MHDSQRIEFGDFQTPAELATACCQIARRQFSDVRTLIEPTCGIGGFLVAGAAVFPEARLMGYDINHLHCTVARRAVGRLVSDDRFEIVKRDFFQCDWQADRQRYSDAVLYLGNPPWVTNSELGLLGGNNLPVKSNVRARRGMDARTGTSNFDISESMLTSLIRSMLPDQDALSMLVKTSTARKVVQQAWRDQHRFSHVSIRCIDAMKHFGVNVDACLLMLQPTNSDRRSTQTCFQSPTLGGRAASVGFGYYENQVVADPVAAKETAHLSSHCQDRVQQCPLWRSGVKHDLAQVLEFQLVDGHLQNGEQRRVEIEAELLFPLAKGSDVANGRIDYRERRVLITQRTMRQSSKDLQVTHPKTWRYLQDHRQRFAARKSSIYRARDPFALFGVGPYTFAPWKVAICGLYKRLAFTMLGPVDDRPVIVDDTCYFLPLCTRPQATFVLKLLSSTLAEEYFQARVFWDAKRPITAKLLRGLSLQALAADLGQADQFARHLSPS